MGKTFPGWHVRFNRGNDSQAAYQQEDAGRSFPGAEAPEQKPLLKYRLFEGTNHV